MCPYGWDLWWVIVNVIRVLGWVCKLTMTWVGLCNMSLGLWCAGVELGGGGRWRGEGQVGTCRADGRERWRTDVRLGPRNLEAGDQLQWLTSGDIDKRKCTWWSDHVDRVKTVVERVERGSGTLGGRSVGRGRWWHASSCGGRVWSTLLMAVRWVEPQNHRVTVSRVWPQNPGKGSEEERGGTWRNHEGYVEAKQFREGSGVVRSTEK
jgi:hypothetical protein